MVASSSLTSHQLQKPLALLTTLFGYIQSVASAPILHKVFRAVASRIETYIWDHVLVRSNFSKRGALQFARDMWEIWGKCAAFTSRPEQGTRRLWDAVHILTIGTKDAQEEEQQKAEQEVLTAIQGGKIDEMRKGGVRTLSLTEARNIVSRRLY